MKTILVSILFAALLGAAGCVKPYNQPKFVDAGPNETVYVIPLSGDTKQQAKFESAAFLEQRKVAAKRIQVPREWVSNGYLWTTGFYQDQVMVIKVNRTPITAEFHQDGPGKKDADAIWIESKDSIGFSTGFSVTGLIKEENASTFLYRYNGRALADVLSTEVRARIQQESAIFAARYILDDLRAKKNEMLDFIKADVIPFFEERGITITTLGQFGGMTYENNEIQSSIDGTFVAQQVKVKNAALLAAQHDANERIKSEAEAMAEAARLKAKGEADGKQSVFEAEAKGLQAVNKALAEANQNPALVELKRIDVQKLQAERWDGHYPTWYMPGASGQGLLLSVNPPSK